MTSVDEYLKRAADLNAKAMTEPNPDLRAALERLAQTYLRLVIWQAKSQPLSQS